MTETLLLADSPRSSSFGRYALCAGSYRISKLCPASKPSEDALMGTECHKHIAEGTSPDDPALRELVEKASAHECELLADFPSDAPYIREKRFFTTHGGYTFQGCPDFAMWDAASNTLLVIDYKFGYTPVRALYNPQLMSYAVHAAKHFDCPDDALVTLAIIQPTIYNSPSVFYTKLDVCKAQTLSILEAVYNPKAVRFPSGDACRYCPAAQAAICPQLKAFTEMEPCDMPTVDQLPPLSRSVFLDRCKLAKDYATKQLETAKKMVEADPQSVPGWYLQSSGCNRTISTSSAWSILASQGVSPDDMMAICTTTPTKAENTLAELYKRKAEEAGEKLTKKAAKEQAVKTLAPYVASSPKSPSLVKY